MLVAMCGLPGTGKSTLAARIADQIGGYILSKDIVRSSLFPGASLTYTREQDDITMAAVYRAAASILRAQPAAVVLLDGRTFLRGYQLHDLFALGAEIGQPPQLIECVCSDDMARARLEADLLAGRHPARNRTVELYQTAKGHAEPITVPHLILDTGSTHLDECVSRSLAYLQKTTRTGD